VVLVSFEVAGFYGVVSRDGAADEVAPALALAEQLIAAGASVLQLRLKHASAATLYTVACALRALTLRAHVPFVVNDRVDVALAAGADGVHLGQEDLPLAAARQLAGARLMIGVSTHSPAQAEAAALAGADYLGFGPVYATATKANPDPVQGIAALAEAVRRARPVPIVAIGGISLACVAEVAASGASAACVISAVNSAVDVVAAGRAVGAAFGRR
jgi:thiamine-phosphate pyrophosphorylase